MLSPLVSILCLLLTRVSHLTYSHSRLGLGIARPPPPSVPLPSRQLSQHPSRMLLIFAHQPRSPMGGYHRSLHAI